MTDVFILNTIVLTKEITVNIHFEFRNFDINDTVNSCSFLIKTDDLKFHVSWDGWAEETLVYAHDEGHESFIDKDSYEFFYVKIDDELKSLKDIFQWVENNLQDFIDSEIDEIIAEEDHENYLRSPYLTGRI